MCLGGRRKGQGSIRLLKAYRAICQGEEASQVKFSKMLGISRKVLSDIEQGRRMISPKKAAQYAELLGCSKK